MIVRLTSKLLNQFTRFSKDMQELLHDSVYVVNVLGTCAFSLAADITFLYLFLELDVYYIK
jgi:hypothetical protein